MRYFRVDLLNPFQNHHLDQDKWSIDRREYSLDSISRDLSCRFLFIIVIDLQIFGFVEVCYVNCFKHNSIWAWARLLSWILTSSYLSEDLKFVFQLFELANLLLFRIWLAFFLRIWLCSLLCDVLWSFLHFSRFLPLKLNKYCAILRISGLSFN